jgi:glycosyltransferase involved in cell wall biosynthesis
VTAPLDILVVSGIWPPDVGGPASHGPEIGAFLERRGHRVRAVISADVVETPPDDPFPVARSRRDLPLPLRMAHGALTLARATSWPDVVYATGIYHRTAVVAGARRLPFVLKLVSDPAYERARSMGLFAGTLEEFQSTHGDRRLRALKRARSWMVGRAAKVVIPSRYLAEIARGWGLAADGIEVVPNPAPDIGPLPDRDAARERLGISGPTFVFAGRLAPQKNLPLAVAALARLPEASLVVIGDGPERERLEQAIRREGVEDRVSVRGALPRAGTFEWMRAADATLLSSDWENHPHAAVESLAVGTPVVATTVGGVPEIVEPGVNGLLVGPGDAAALSEAMASVIAAGGLLEKLRSGAEASAGRFSADAAFGAIEREIAAAAGRGQAAVAAK